MTPQQVQAHFKAPTPSALARILGKPISTVQEWFQRGVVPRPVQWEMEAKTGGRLKAKVK